MNFTRGEVGNLNSIKLLSSIQRLALLCVQASAVEQNRTKDRTECFWDDVFGEGRSGLQLLRNTRRVCAALEFHGSDDEHVFGRLEEENEVASSTRKSVSWKRAVRLRHDSRRRYIGHEYLAPVPTARLAEKFLAHLYSDMGERVTHGRSARLSPPPPVGSAAPPNDCRVPPRPLRNPSAPPLRRGRRGSLPLSSRLLLVPD